MLLAAQLFADQFGSKSSLAWKTLVHTAIQATEYELTRRVKNKLFLCVWKQSTTAPLKIMHMQVEDKKALSHFHSV